MDETDFDEMPAGKEMDCLIAERVMGWHRVQAPKFDYDGPLPEQGEVLVSPILLPMIESNEYQWPPKGVVPFGFFVNARYSTRIEGAWQLAEKLRAFSVYRHSSGDWQVWAWNGTHIGASASTAPLAICRAALKVFTRPLPTPVATPQRKS